MAGRRPPRRWRVNHSDTWHNYHVTLLIALRHKWDARAPYLTAPAYFTAPSVNPCTRYRCNAANTTATGSVASKVAAIT